VACIVGRDGDTGKHMSTMQETAIPGCPSTVLHIWAGWGRIWAGKKYIWVDMI